LSFSYLAINFLGNIKRNKHPNKGEEHQISTCKIKALFSVRFKMQRIPRAFTMGHRNFLLPENMDQSKGRQTTSSHLEKKGSNMHYTKKLDTYVMTPAKK